MLAEILIQLYERDLNKLVSEIEQFSDEADLWKTSGDITNSAGNLSLHLAGNLQHFIGAILGDSGYARDRDAEFSSSGIPKQQLLEKIDAALKVVGPTLEKLTSEDFAKTYPLEVFGHPMTTGYFLVHLATHLNYHLGQINYLRRALTTASPV